MAKPTPAIDPLTPAERAVVVDLIARAMLAAVLRDHDDDGPTDDHTRREIAVRD